MAKSKRASADAAMKHFTKHHMHVSFSGKNRSKVHIKVSAEPHTKSLHRANSCAGCSVQSFSMTVCPRWPC
jgi:hypothetical protein